MSKNRVEPDIQLKKHGKSRKPSISDDDSDNDYVPQRSSFSMPSQQKRNNETRYPLKDEPNYKSRAAQSPRESTISTVSMANANIKQPNQTNTENSNLDGKPTVYLFGCLIVAAFGASFQIGWTSNILDFRTQINLANLVANIVGISEDLLYILSGLFAGIFPLGAIFGALFSGFLTNVTGRKGALLLANIFVAIGAAILIILATLGDSASIKRLINVDLLKLIAKLICGLYVGFFSGIIPIYLSEMPTKNIRGLSGVLNQVFILFGSLICAVSEQFGVKIIQILPNLITSVGYHLTTVIAALVFLPLAVHFGMFFLSDSPARLIYRRHTDRAEKELVKLRNNDTQLIKNEIKEVEENEKELDSSCCTRVFWILVVIQFAQHFTGIYAVTKVWQAIMAPKILSNKPLVWNYVEIIMGTQLGITLIAMFLVDRVGRKILLIVGYAGMGLSSILIGVAATAEVPDMAVVCAFLLIIFYAIGPGPISWLIVPECVTTAARGKTVSGVMALNWFFLFVLTLISPILFKEIEYDNFYIFGSIGIASAVFVWVFLPETKKKSPSEIVKAFSEKTIFIKEIL